MSWCGDDDGTADTSDGFLETGPDAVGILALELVDDTHDVTVEQNF